MKIIKFKFKGWLSFYYESNRNEKEMGKMMPFLSTVADKMAIGIIELLAIVEIIKIAMQLLFS
jgi:hypothetical protein